MPGFLAPRGPAPPSTLRAVEAARPVTVLSAGGTIAMGGAGGAVPQLDADALVGAVPELAGLSGLRARTLGSWPGAHVGAAEALGIARAAAAEAAEGRGVVVTHGTDTLEETAVLCDVVAGAEAPIVLTGAIRPSSAAGADGPGNLLDAVRVAGSPAAAGRGALVVFAGEIHAARAVRKVDSTAPAAFGSPRRGPVGRVTEEAVALWGGEPRRAPLDVRRLDARVEIVATGLGGDGVLLEAALAAGADGLVAVVLGAGHAPPAFLEAIRAAAARVPVVVCVRPERGRAPPRHLRLRRRGARRPRERRDPGPVALPRRRPDRADGRAGGRARPRGRGRRVRGRRRGLIARAGGGLERARGPRSAEGPPLARRASGMLRPAVRRPASCWSP